MEPTYVSTKLRCFSGLIRLYYDDQGDRKSWTLVDVKTCVKRWIEHSQLSLCVIVSNVESLFYECSGVVVEEPSVRIYGEIERTNSTVLDNKIKEALLSLFSFLKVELKQYSVSFHFQGYTENSSIRIC